MRSYFQCCKVLCQSLLFTTLPTSSLCCSQCTGYSNALKVLKCWRTGLLMQNRRHLYVWVILLVANIHRIFLQVYITQICDISSPIPYRHRLLFQWFAVSCSNCCPLMENIFLWKNSYNNLILATENLEKVFSKITCVLV